MQIVDLSRGIADLARQIGQLEQRHAALANGTETALQRLSAHNQPLTAEVAELGTIVRQLAEQAGEVVPVSTLGERLAATPTVPGGNGAGAPDLAENGGQPPPDGTSALVSVVRQAMQSGAIDTYVQPIVILPQRKVCAYEAAALGWAAEHARELGAQAGRLLVAGQLAGAARAARLAIDARDSGWPVLRRQVLVRPAFAQRCPVPVHLARSAPATIVTSGRRGDDGSRYAAALRDAGVEVQELVSDARRALPFEDLARTL